MHSRASVNSLRRIRDIVRRIGNLREVRTKTYLSGMRMVDLESSGGSSPVISRVWHSLLVPDERLARVVSLLLRDAGFAVERSDDAAKLDAVGQGPRRGSGGGGRRRWRGRCPRPRGICRPRPIARIGLSPWRQAQLRAPRAKRVRISCFSFPSIRGVLRRR